MSEEYECLEKKKKKEKRETFQCFGKGSRASAPFCRDGRSEGR